MELQSGMVWGYARGCTRGYADPVPHCGHREDWPLVTVTGITEKSSEIQRV